MAIAADEMKRQYQSQPGNRYGQRQQQQHLVDSDCDESDITAEFSHCEGRLVIDLSSSDSTSTNIDVINSSNNFVNASAQQLPTQTPPKIQQSQSPPQPLHKPQAIRPPIDAFCRWWVPAVEQSAEPAPPPPACGGSCNFCWNQPVPFQQQQQQQHQQQQQQQQQNSRRWGPPPIISDRLCACIGCAVSSSLCQAWQPPPPQDQRAPPPAASSPVLPKTSTQRVSLLPHPSAIQHQEPQSPPWVQWCQQQPPMRQPRVKQPSRARTRAMRSPPSIGCFNCRWCHTEPFRSCRQLALHIQRRHLMPNDCCGICGSANAGLAHCRQHAAESLTATGRSAFLCAACDGRIFASRSALKRHSERHHGGRV